MMKKIITALIFVAGILVTLFFERISESIFPKSNETVNLAKDTLFVIPVSNEKYIVEKDSELNYSTNGELEYWKKKALEKENLSYESLTKKIENLKKEIRLEKSTNKSSTEFISDKEYNKLVTSPKKLLPNKKGYQPTTITNFFEGKCPNFKINDDYINLDFLIRDKNVYEKSGVIFVSMSGIKNDGHHYFIYDEYYKPQYGYNHLKIKNINNPGKYVFTYGIIFKTDMNEEFPKINGFKCHFNK